MMWPHYVTWLMLGIIGGVLMLVGFAIYDDIQGIKAWVAALHEAVIVEDRFVAKHGLRRRRHNEEESDGTFDE